MIEGKVLEIAQILGLFLIVAQLFVMLLSFRADHRRRKRQATVEYISRNSEYHDKLLRKLRSKLSHDALEKANPINPHMLDEDDQQIIRHYLGTLESLAIAIRRDVFDLEIIRLLRRNAIKQWFRIFKLYIDEIRRTTGVNSYYEELEWLTKRL